MNPMDRPNNWSERGVTLLEIGIGLAISAVAAYLVIRWAAVTSVVDASKSFYTSMSFVQTRMAMAFPQTFAGIGTCSQLIDKSIFSSTSFLIDRSDTSAARVFYSHDASSILQCSTVQIVLPGDGYMISAAGLDDAFCNEVVERMAPLSWLINVDGQVVKDRATELNLVLKGSLCSGSIQYSNDHAVKFVLSRTLPYRQ